MAGQQSTVVWQGVCFLAAIIISGWTGVTMVLTPAFALAMIPGTAPYTHLIYRRISNFVQWMWMANVSFLLECLFGIDVVVHGSPELKAKEDEVFGERALWISNHRTRIDWMLLWSLALRTGSLSQLKIILKAPLKKAPIFGWAMQHFLFIFLRRNWAEDQEYLRKFLPFLAEKEPKASYLLFPEGTDLSDGNLEKSAAFAEKNGLPRRVYSLYPRTTGWNFMFPLLKSNLDAVYDVTMFYVDYVPNERPSEKALVSGRLPRAIHFYVERIPIEDIRSSEEELKAWVEARFKQKEEHLRVFYEENGRLPPNAVRLCTQPPTAMFVIAAAFWVALIALALQWAWTLGWWGIVYGIAVIVGYSASSIVYNGVDGFLVNIL
ncbi:TPA: hypothetical protein N0F65_001493 [Lagenidium giganteum]|uniref:Phospholipid/glycerol acyltransferase domain-containing protein n=1 Tax=Lagenidium giganteum TaxID=4803 RepID=A0AAV2YZ00_9STRA|nr:TPA: hypothetical protein N0F65_001493 [Lagenidium giganteum]